MKILVTGCAGFIGSDLTEYFLDRGYEVIGIDNFNHYYDPKIKEFNISEFKNRPKFKLYRVDITDRPALWKLFEENELDGVVHFAAYAGVTQSNLDPNTWVFNNVDGTNNLAEFAAKKGVKSFVFSSTSSVYGANPVPYKEEMSTDGPLGIYPATKKAGEALLHAYATCFGLPVTILRFFNPIGPRLRPDMAVPKLVRAAEYGYTFTLYQGTDSARDYTYIDNMAQAVETCLVKPFRYEVLNIGNSRPVTLKDLFDSVEKVTGKKINSVRKDRPGQMQITCADITKAQKLIGYSPQTTLNEMVAKYYDWFLRQPEWYKKGAESWMQ
ncbi:MAG: NAD-dependent epimerase/dehydratase family protein [bacterium]